MSVEHSRMIDQISSIIEEYISDYQSTGDDETIICLESDLEDARSKIEELETEISDLESEVETLTLTIDDLEKENVNLEDQVGDLQEEIQKLKDQLEIFLLG